MAGHSKWANIQHRKNAQDAKRGKLFTKLIREITVAARMGGGDPNSNPRLRLGIDKALAANMSKDVVNRAIQKGIGGLEGQNMEEIWYEGYGTQGVAVLVECLTDNKNRTVSEIRFAFTKCGGNLGTSGSVNYLFTKKGQILFAPGASEDKIMEVGLDVGADDIVVNSDQSIEVITSPENFENIKAGLIKNNLNPAEAEITWLASTKVKLDDDAVEKMERLINMLEELDDVQNVYTNVDW